MITLKNCKSCPKRLPENEFPSAGIINGKQYYRAKCKTCYHKIKLARKRKIAKWLRDYKSTLHCSRCPEDDFRVLEFHHVNGDKEFNVSDAATTGLSVKNILKEINKCEVICSNCHKRIHYDERNGD